MQRNARCEGAGPATSVIPCGERVKRDAHGEARTTYEREAREAREAHGGEEGNDVRA